ncbi:hypothetical protein [Schlesneria paludicola]|uniref:hypothetical protein n=1 Tax=Schlesneria paludicola TaxID=360056 RepID=UPI0012FB3410|nr:hypothetical protein [Schlesneria paludicola]
MAEKNIFPSIAVAICVPIAFALFRRNSWFRFVTTPEFIATRESLIEKYRRTEKIVNLVSPAAAFGLTGLILYLTAHPLMKLFNSAVQPDPDDLFFARYTGPAVLMPALFWAMLLSFVIVLSLCYVVLGRRVVRDLMLLSDSRLGFQTGRVLSFLALSILIITGMGTWMMVDCWIRLKPDRIEVNRFLTLGTRSWPLSDVQRLVAVHSFKAPSGNVIYRPSAKIVMKDGTVISTEQVLHLAYFRRGEYDRMPVFESERQLSARRAEIVLEMLETISESADVAIEIEDPYPAE